MVQRSSSKPSGLASWPVLADSIPCAPRGLAHHMTPSAEIKVLSSLATREAYRELVPQFERASGRQVVTTWAGTVDIIKRISAGERFDLIIAANSTIDDFIQAGRVEN